MSRARALQSAESASSPSPLHDTASAAAYLRGKAESHSPRPQTLAWWRVTGAGPAFIKVGNAVRYRERDLERWLDAQTRTHTREVPA